MYGADIGLEEGHNGKQHWWLMHNVVWLHPWPLTLSHLILWRVFRENMLLYLVKLT